MMSVLACVLAVVASNVFGYLWYSPSVGFGNAWFRLSFPGKKFNDMKQKKKPIILSVVGQALMTAVLYCLNSFYEVGTLRQGVQLATWLGALICGSQVCHAAFHERSAALYFIDCGFDVGCIYVIQMVLMYF